MKGRSQKLQFSTFHQRTLTETSI